MHLPKSQDPAFINKVAFAMIAHSEGDAVPEDLSSDEGAVKNSESVDIIVAPSLVSNGNCRALCVTV